MKSIITLLLICLISAISLTYINQLTAKQRSENQNKKLQEAKKNVLSDEIKNKMASISEAIEIENVKVYKVLDAQGGKLAIIAEFSGQGFAGDIKLLAAIDNDYKVLGLKPLSHSETPGLGAKIEEVNSSIAQKIKQTNKLVDEKKPWFCEQFKGLGIEKLKLKKEGGEIDAITASTITSRAVTNAVSKTIEVIKSKGL